MPRRALSNQYCTGDGSADCPADCYGSPSLRDLDCDIAVYEQEWRFRVSFSCWFSMNNTLIHNYSINYRYKNYFNIYNICDIIRIMNNRFRFLLFPFSSFVLSSLRSSWTRLSRWQLFEHTEKPWLPICENSLKSLKNQEFHRLRNIKRAAFGYECCQSAKWIASTGIGKYTIVLPLWFVI